MYMRDPKDYLQPTDISIELRTLKEIFSNSCKKKKKKKFELQKMCVAGMAKYIFKRINKRCITSIE